MRLNSEEIRALSIAPEVSIKNAMKALSAGACKILFVVDGSRKLLGSISDGDIRRSILNGGEFETPVSDVMHKSPRFVRYNEDGYRAAAKQQMERDMLEAIPALDGENRIVEILFWHEFLEKHPSETQHPIKTAGNSVVIMAGGKGARLDPFTKILPKPLIPFGEKPVIEIIMDNFGKHGFNSFTLILNYKKDLIKMYFRENQLPYHIDWIEEQDYLGTAGGIRLLKGKIKDTFFVCNCDTLLDHDFNQILEWHKKEKALITMIGCHKEMVLPYGTLEVNNGQLRAIRERPRFDMMVNIGVYLMEPAVIDFIQPDERIDMNTLIQRAAQSEKVTVYPICDGWFDFGQWKEYNDSVNLLENKKKDG